MCGKIVEMFNTCTVFSVAIKCYLSSNTRVLIFYCQMINNISLVLLHNNNNIIR